MNYIDYMILAVIGVSTFIGMYYGFTVSVLSIASFFVSWLSAFIFYPVLSKIIIARYPDIIEKLILYTDGASKTPIDYRSLPVSSLSSEKITQIVDNARLPYPFNEILQHNIISKSIESISNLGQYFDYTIASIILNILSFLLIFLTIRLIFMILISIASNIVDLPVLKQFDTLLGAGLGFLRGILVLFVIFALVPVFLTLAPVDILTKYLDESLFAHFFLDFNIFTSFIKGII